MAAIVDYVRKTFTEGDQKRDEGLTTPPDIIRYDDIRYGDDEKWQCLDVYRPAKEEGKKLPVIVNVHGGGWVYGDKERYQYYCMSLAQRGFVVVNFTYRLAPETKFPGQLEDVNLVFRWVLEHTEEYGMDKDFIFGTGDSAGANLLGLYTAACTNPAYAAKYEFKIPQGFIPKALALNCGPYRIEMNDPEDLTQKLLRELLPEGGTDEEAELISVALYVTEDFPPTYLMTAIDDFVRPQSYIMAEKLKECKVPHVFKVYGSEGNRLRHVFHCNMKMKDAHICNDEECSFFMEIYNRKREKI